MLTLNKLIRKPFKSTVSDLIAYEFSNLPQSEQMIQDIIDCQNKWSILRTKIPAHLIEGVERKFIEKYCEINTDPLEESGHEQKKQESQNLGKLIDFFKEVVKEAEPDCCGLIEKSIVQKAHKIAVYGKNIKEGCTPPGEFSTNERFTTHHSFEGEYQYRQPEDMGKEVDIVLDRFNSLLIHSLVKSDGKERLNGIVKTLAWFLFEILDLHPFGNGNGRLFRCLCFYVLFSCGQTVVASPLYNMCTNTEASDHSNCRKPCKDSYELSLISARNSITRHPEELASMLLKSCWKTWHEFIEEINKSIPEK